MEIPKRKTYNGILGFVLENDQVCHNNGGVRPATDVEKILWAEWQRVKVDHNTACQHYWEIYQAGTGKTIDTFDGVTGSSPTEEVRKERNRLISIAHTRQRTIDYVKKNNIAFIVSTRLIELLNPEVNNVEEEDQGTTSGSSNGSEG